MVCIGRSSEREALRTLVEGAREGLSGALMLSGEAGVGKTALLDDIAEYATAHGVQVVRLTGIESETQLGYAVLHRLLLPYSGHLERLPPPQRDALRSTFGLVPGPPADRFMVALGVLTLLADVATETPLLCLIDDAHWLDPESQVVLGFVARRLGAEKIAMVLATRDLGLPPAGPLPELVIGGLSDSEARELISYVGPGRVSPYVAGALAVSTGGNPLALVELIKELTPEQLSGISPLPEPLPVGRSLQAVFSRRVNRLPPESQLLLALAATEPSATQETLWRAAVQLGIDPELASAGAGDLVAFTPNVTFRHSLVCSVAYLLTPISQRRLIHKVLAEQGEEPDRVAWHLAMAASGPDEAVASKLEQSAERARERGGYAARVTFLVQAAELSASDDVRTERVLAAAEAAVAAGQPVRARSLLDQAESSSTSARQAALALRLAGEVSLATGHTGDAARELLGAARHLMPIDPQLGRQTLLGALTAANYTRIGVLEEVCAFGAEVLGSHDLDESSVSDRLLLGFLRRLSGAPHQAAGLLRAAVDQLLDPRTPDDIRMSMPIVVGPLACAELFDEDAAPKVIETYVSFARRAGALRVLPPALTSLSAALIRQGRFDEAQRAYTEGRTLGEATGAPGSPDVASRAELSLLCWRGREAEARELAAHMTEEERLSGGDTRSYRGQSPFYLAVLELGLGRYRQAYEYALPVFQDDRLGFGTFVLPNLIEASSRCHELPMAHEALIRLEQRAEASGSSWGLGLLARCQALLADGGAEPLYRRSIDLLSTGGTELARAHLLYGEWLRRQRRPSEALVELRTAHDMFSEIGAEGFAARAEAELGATGQRSRRRRMETRETLTPQETQVALRVAEGGTNREVAAELFISPATVDYHLRKVYLKLGITSRTQLVREMRQPDQQTS